MEELFLEVLAEKAYTAYHEYLDNSVSPGYFGKEKSGKFEDVSDETRHAWIEVVKEIIRSYPQMRD